MTHDQLQALKDFCNASGIEVPPRTREIIDRRLEGQSYSQMQTEGDIEPGNARRLLREFEARMNKRGFNRHSPHQNAVEDGYTVKGKSTLISYGRQGIEKRLEWVKTEADKERQAELYKAFIEGLCKDITPAKPVKQTKGLKYSKELMPSIFIGDAHIGMRAFGTETKHHDFDTEIATEQLKDAFEYLTARAEPSENALFVDVGDAIHANTQHGTTVSGTPLDVDTRHYSVMKATAECMAYGINLQLKRHKNVTVVIARGNHNSDAAGAIQLMLEFYYKDEKRVNVLPTHGFFHYIEWGKWLLGIHHGDKQKPEKLATTMARDMAEAWGRTTHRMWCTGHFHKEAVKTLDGVKHKVFAALPPPDSWHASHGFAGDGEMEMLTFKKSGGIHSSFVYNVPSPRIEPDVRIP